jgi:hypothetical protein
MKKLFIGLAAVPFLAGVAMAGQPTPLSDSAMDQVTAGYEYSYQFIPPSTASSPGAAAVCTASCILFSDPSEDGKLLEVGGFPSLTVH